MKMLRLIAAAAMIGGATVSFAQSQTMSAQEFANTAASSDMFEIRSSQLALDKVKNDSLRDFAQMMIDDHTAASKELQAAAQQDGVTVPADMMEKHASQLQTLQQAPADGFDKTYRDAQVAAHEEALALMQSYAQSGEGAALKGHAAKTAPVIEKHLERIQELGQ